MASTRNHEEIRAELLAKAAADDAFRARLVDDPKAAIKEALGYEVPDAMAVHVHEDTATAAHLVLPPSAELSDADLEVVAGGDKTVSLYGGSTRHAHRRADGTYEVHD